MNFRMIFDGGSFAFGTICASIAADQLPVWVIIPAIVLLFDIPGPKLSYASSEGWRFKWWTNPT